MDEGRLYNYPIGIDCLWVASDIFGNIGAFFTAGFAPIPRVVLSEKYGDILDVGDALMELPIVSRSVDGNDARHLADFNSLAERGIFAFDWSDVHKVPSKKMHAYEKLASPESPISVDELNGGIRNCATLAILEGVNFSTDSYIRCKDTLSARRDGNPEPIS
nr:hypothetical protein [uncultured Gellertiella sp.]